MRAGLWQAIAACAAWAFAFIGPLILADWPGLAIAAGRLADRFDNRLLMYWGLGTYTVSLVLPYFFPSLAMLYFVAPLWGFTSMLWVVATQNLVGVLSQRDCLEVALTAAQDTCIAGPVAQYMSEKPQTVDPETNLTQLATMFCTAPFRRYPVIENGQLVGQISRSDVLRAIMAAECGGTITLQKKVEDNKVALKDRQDLITVLLSDITDADPYEAATRLSSAQTALEASAKAFTTLQGSSLLNLLSR